MQQTRNALLALRNVLRAYRRTFEGIEDPYFRERADDVEDVGRRVMERLLGVRHQLEPMPEGSIVVADNILPGHFARFEIEKVAAIVSEHGGPTSHGAIFARTLEIPAVTGVVGIQAAVRSGEIAIVDGGDGQIHLSPDERLIAEYRRAQRRYAVAIQHLDALRERPGETRDGHRISLTANVGLVSDLRLVEQHGADGIGLFRTELLVLAHRGFPEEEEQAQLYTSAWLGRSMPRPVTIRTLDVGGDKDLAGLTDRAEENPQLGCRSIRLSLEHEGVFRAQLRAVLRASASCNVRLLLPMISALSELRIARRLRRGIEGGSRAGRHRLRTRVADRDHDRGAFRGADRGRARARVRLLQHRHERSHAIHAGGGPRQRARVPSLRSAAPRGAGADRPQRARGRECRDPDLAVRGDGEQSARRAAAGGARDRGAVLRAERGARGEGDRARARLQRRRGGRRAAPAGPAAPPRCRRSARRACARSA